MTISTAILHAQHLSANMQPEGVAKRIPYASIEFVGPFDDTQVPCLIPKMQQHTQRQWIPYALPCHTHITPTSHPHHYHPHPHLHRTKPCVVIDFFFSPTRA